MYKKYLIKVLKKGIKRDIGRNNKGRITSRHKGGGLKPKIKFISYNLYQNVSNKFTVYGETYNKLRGLPLFLCKTAQDTFYFSKGVRFNTFNKEMQNNIL